MKDFLQHNMRAVLIAVTVIIIAGVVVFYGSSEKMNRAIFNNERVFTETPKPRLVENVTTSGGRDAVSTGENIALVSDVHVVIDGGKTLKESYTIAKEIAVVWAPDAMLIYIRSLGTVTVDGMSSGWEVVFGSKAQKEGYVVSVVGGVVVEKKETVSSSPGYEVPTNWYDAGEAIKSIQTLPQFKDATISGLNFYYNEDGKKWGYAISSSKGTVSVPVR